MRIVVPRDEAAAERSGFRFVPESVKRLLAKKIDVSVEAGAGARAHVSDDEYKGAGATIEASRAALFASADAIVRVRIPTVEEIGAMKEGAALDRAVLPAPSAGLVKALAARKMTSFALDLIPRTTVAQMMDVLSSQATVAGYCAVLMAATELPGFPDAHDRGRDDRAGAGARPRCRRRGLQAIGTARRLGAVVEAFDVRKVVKEQVESLGAKFVEVESAEDAQTAGGYAKERARSTRRSRPRRSRSTWQDGGRRHLHRAHPRAARADPRDGGDGEVDEGRLGHRRPRRRAAGKLRAHRDRQGRREARRDHHGAPRPPSRSPSTRARCTRATSRSCSSTSQGRGLEARREGRDRRRLPRHDERRRGAPQGEGADPR